MQEEARVVELPAVVFCRSATHSQFRSQGCRAPGRRVQPIHSQVRPPAHIHQRALVEVRLWLQRSSGDLQLLIRARLDCHQGCVSDACAEKLAHDRKEADLREGVAEHDARRNVRKESTSA